MPVSKTKNRANMLMEDPISKLIPKMALPTIVSFLINSVYSLADTYFVSSIGTNATAAVSVNSSLDQFIFMAGSLFAIGASSYCSRLLGAQDEEKANQVLSTSYFLALLFGALILLFGTVFMRPMVRMLGATDSCEKCAIDYATYVLYVAPIMAGSFVLNQCLRAEGSPLFSMFGMSFGGILNCVLDPIFIFHFGLGVAGASMATAISKVVSFCILMFPYLTKRSILHISIRLFRPTKQIITEVVSVGSSSMLRSALAVISAIILNNIAGSISDSVLAGIGVTTKIMMFPFSIILGLGTGFQPVAGFNWGARRYDRVRESFRFTSWAAIIISGTMGLLLCFFAIPVIHLFTETDPVMQEIGALSIRLQSIVLPVHAWVAIVNMLCAGLGKAKYALTLSTARQGTCFLPFVHLVTYAFGAYGVASIQAIADLLTLVIAIPILRKMIRIIHEAERESFQFSVGY